MSDIELKLLFITCVSLLSPLINGIQNTRVVKTDHNWRQNNRQDLYTQPRYLIWKPQSMQVPPMYVSPKTSLMTAPMPINYNRYGFPHMPPMHHQSYMFAIPPATKAMTYPYAAIKDMGEQRKPGNFHHITIINAVIPKAPYFPPPTTSTKHHHQQHHHKTLRNYRKNKQFYQQYFNSHPNWQNTTVSRIPIQPLPQTQMKKHQTAPTVAQTFVDKNSALLLNLFKNNVINNGIEKNVNGVQCLGNSVADSMQVSTNTLHYICKMLKNVTNQTEHREQHRTQQSAQNVTTTTMPTITSTSIKSIKSNMDLYTTQKPIFLPTPFVSRVNMIFPQSTVTSPNFATFMPLKTNDEPILTIRPTQRSLIRSESQQHSFFTIEDAITKNPVTNHIFNDPYEAMIHARKRQQQYVKPQRAKNIPSRTTSSPLIANFFDDNVHETSETHLIDEYSTFKNHQENVAPISYGSNFFMDDYRRSNRSKQMYNSLQPILSDSKFNEVPKPKYSEQFQYSSLKPYDKFVRSTTSTTTTTTEAPSFFDFFDEEPIETVTAEATTKELETPANGITTTYFNHFNSKNENQELEKTTSLSVITEKPLSTTIATSTTTTTTTENTIQKVPSKRPFHLLPTSAYKYKKPLRGLFKINKTFSTTSTTTTSSPVTKKTQKYQRQYKSKKNRHMKLSLPSARSQSITSTPATSTTPEASTMPRSKSRAQTTTTTSSSVSVKTKRIQSNGTVTNPTRNSAKRQSVHRTTEKTPSVSSTRTRGKNKSRRRNPHISDNSKASTTSESIPQLTTKSGSTAITSPITTTVKTILRATHETRTKKYSKNLTSSANTVQDDLTFANNNQVSKTLKSVPTKDGAVPPLPIEIYFKKIQNAKI